MVQMKHKRDSKLKQLLLASCKMMANNSVRCRNDFVAHNTSFNNTENTSSCDWYHSAWQYLRILDCVSSPEWHCEFYEKAFEKVLKRNTDLNILISGTADYSLLYLILSLVKNSGKKICIDIADLCPTPLTICDWLKDNIEIPNNVTIRTIICNIAMYYADHQYDIICSDAFLTRFSKKEVRSVVDKWRQCLTPNGRIVTTVRLNDGNNADIPSLIDKSLDINAFCTKVVTAYIELTDVEKDAMDISTEELRFMAFRYIERMKSNALGDAEQIKRIFAASGLRIIDDESETDNVEGEIHATTYYRIVAQINDKKNRGSRK